MSSECGRRSTGGSKAPDSRIPEAACSADSCRYVFAYILWLIFGRRRVDQVFGDADVARAFAFSNNSPSSTDAPSLRFCRGCERQ